jgi:hypothetical protein
MLLFALPMPLSTFWPARQQPVLRHGCRLGCFVSREVEPPHARRCGHKAKRTTQACHSRVFVSFSLKHNPSLQARQHANPRHVIHASPLLDNQASSYLRWRGLHSSLAPRAALTTIQPLRQHVMGMQLAQLAVLKGHEAAVLCVASLDGGCLLSGDEHGGVAVHDLATAESAASHKPVLHLKLADASGGGSAGVAAVAPGPSPSTFLAAVLRTVFEVDRRTGSAGAT